MSIRHSLSSEVRKPSDRGFPVLSTGPSYLRKDTNEVKRGVDSLRLTVGRDPIYKVPGTLSEPLRNFFV